MTEARQIIHVTGLFLLALGIAMLIPAILDLWLNNDNWINFALAATFTIFIGTALALANNNPPPGLTPRQAFLITISAWIFMTSFGALPIYWSTFESGHISYTDAFFETMSGLTTTGATILSGLDKAPEGLLLWRALLHWIGGIGIIVMAIAVLPMLQVGGMQLFRLESSDTSENILPRASELAASFSLLYLGLTTACALGYWLTGMNSFDAITHAMATLSTGGFSTHDASMGHFEASGNVNAWKIELVCIIFMIMGSLPFVLYLQALRHRRALRLDFRPLLTDSQVRWFFITLTILTLIAWQTQATDGHEVGLLEFRDAAFSVTSIMTGTGFATVDYTKWSLFAPILFFCITFIGGCAGSTCGGFKIFRFLVIFKSIRLRISSFIYPRGVFVSHFNGKPLSNSVIASVMGFLFLFLLCYISITFLLSLYDQIDLATAFSGAATAMANVGPGIGNVIGPSGNFKTLPDGAKWLLSLGMLLGRLELLTVLVLVLPSFWRR